MRFGSVTIVFNRLQALSILYTLINHSWWRHQLDTFSALLAICARVIHRSAVNSPHKGQWRGALMFSLICAWINGWVSNRKAGDLKWNRAHNDVSVMYCIWYGYTRHGICFKSFRKSFIQNPQGQNKVEYRYHCVHTFAIMSLLW